jgi:cytoskeleton protein RodZ
LQAPLPVSVVVGRADALQVRFKGQAFDLTPHSKMNVARFEVKP